VGASITSGLGEYYEEAYRGHLDQTPHVRFFDERNGGYVRCDVTQEEWRVEMKLADSISDPDSPVPTFASFVVEDGKPGAERT
jgi:alkaline phosphatase D